MAVYAAVVPFKEFYSKFLHYYDVALPPETMKLCENAYKELKSLLDFLERLDSRSRKRMSAWLQRSEEALDKCKETYLKEAELEILDEITRSLLETLKKIREELLDHDHIEEEVVSSSSLLSSFKMTGIRDERSRLKEALVNVYMVGESVFLLNGMAGIGKTTLAREVYQDLDISEWFDCRAWVTVGNEWRSKEITKAILAQLDPHAHKMVMGGDEKEITQQLKNCLKLGKRCLIVVDDVWDLRVFLDYAEAVLLHGVQGCRVVLTSRMKDLIISGHWYVLEKRLLNKKESWDLLREKAFVGGLCPPQLEDYGKKIADKCHGLPLTIVTVANNLSMAEESIWINVAEKKRHQVFSDAYDQISKVLYPSYKELDDGFKLCFLYMGVFPLKSEIHRSKLINLWSAEKIFDQFKKGESPYAAFLLLTLQLDNRSLVMVYQRSISSSLVLLQDNLPIPIRILGLHSSWWHFCQREARKTNFFHVIDCPEDALDELIRGQSRLSIHNNVLFAFKNVHNSIEKNCASTAQSLLCFGPYHQYMVPLCFGLRFLQRLDALNIRFYDFPLEVLELAKLLYLALTCNKQLPPFISKLEKLQYLIVHPHLSIKSSRAPTYMPMEIWDLEELKHLEVLGSDLPDPGDKSLEMLSTLLDVSTASCSVLNKLPNLEKLRIRIVLTPEAPDPLYCLDHISKQRPISSVTCIVVNPGFSFQIVHPVASFPVFPSWLKKLSLSGLGYPWEKMRGMSSIRSLRVLELQCNAFYGQIWEVEEWAFGDLEFLLIEDLDLVKLKVGPRSFNNLNLLSIKHCYKLEEIQLRRFTDVRKIEIVDSNPIVEKSIKLQFLEERGFAEHLLVHKSWKSA